MSTLRQPYSLAFVAQRGLDEDNIHLNSEERTALAEIARERMDISKALLRRLFMLHLVERQMGIVRVTRRGRVALGLSE